MTGLAVLASIAVSAAATRWALAPVLRLLTEGALLRPNYRGRPIPIGAGLAVIVGGSVGVLAALPFVAAKTQTQGLQWVFVAFSLGFVGFVDDTLGSHETKGLHGHVLTLLKGRLTTGGLKALLGVVVASMIAVANEGPWPRVLLGAGLIALGANTVNLLDLRPGRAVKAFIAVGLCLGLATGGQAMWLAPFVVATMVYARTDLRAQAMLGDVGANALGGMMGLAFYQSLPPLGAGVALAAMAALHGVAERVSLTHVIERQPLLRWLDQWGRARDD